MSVRFDEESYRLLQVELVRRPEGPARVLLQVAAAHPEALLEVVRKT